MKKENVIVTKSFDFALLVIELYKQMIELKEFVLTKQLLRSGTSIGANIQEATLLFQKKILSPKCQLHQKKPVKQNIGCSC